MEAFTLLPDPQTNGGLLIAVEESGMSQVVGLLNDSGYKDFITPIGKIIAVAEKTIFVMP